MEKIGILTGGGDCPGLNSVIRAVERRSSIEGWQVIGFKYGWKGLQENDFTIVDNKLVSGILPKGGTILGTSRTNPYKDSKGVELVKKTFQIQKLKALVAVGGEDTLGVAAKLYQNEKLPIVGVPKTIDNDLFGTELTFGYDTAINIVTECIDRLHTTAESHNRVMVVEIMGRHAGWITLESGLAGGADVILIPEFPMTIEEICELIKKRHARGKTFSIVAVAEGAKLAGKDVTLEEKKDQFGHVRLGGVGQQIAEMIEQRTGFETRVTVLGHIQRGGTPTAFDRVLGTRFGVKAVELIKQNKLGYMASLQGQKIGSIELKEVLGKLKLVPEEYFNLAKLFFG